MTTEEQASVQNLAEKCNLLKVYHVFLSFATDYLGSETQFVETIRYERAAATIWHTAKRYGNMGHNCTTKETLLDKIKFIKSNINISRQMSLRLVLEIIMGGVPKNIMNSFLLFRKKLYDRKNRTYQKFIPQ